MKPCTILLSRLQIWRNAWQRLCKKHGIVQYRTLGTCGVEGVNFVGSNGEVVEFCRDGGLYIAFLKKNGFVLEVEKAYYKARKLGFLMKDFVIRELPLLQCGIKFLWFLARMSYYSQPLFREVFLCACA